MRKRRSVGPILLWFALAACGREASVALDEGDPLHEGPIGLPPPARWEPPEPPARSAEEIHAPPPPFSEGIFPCSRCHEGGDAAPVDRAPAVPHQTHLDRDLLCADCHFPEGGAEPRVPAAELCFDCHEPDEESAAVRGYFAAVRNEAGEYVLPRRWRTRDVIAAHPVHAAAKVECVACHGEPSNQPFRKPRSVPLMDRCLACHEERRAPVSCETCHEEIREPQHADIVLRHADQRGCFGCHDEEDRDTLRLASGRPIPFEESYRLCGQCHGPKLRDWRLGLHGKRTGMWDGPKEYLLCVHCHRDPHAPQYPPMKPDPPPVRPEDVR